MRINFFSENRCEDLEAKINEFFKTIPSYEEIKEIRLMHDYKPYSVMIIIDDKKNK